MPSKKSPPAPVPETLTRLEHLYGDAGCSLDFGSPLQLLAATILSAQCTDARVNMVTPELFRRFPTAAALAAAPSGAIEEVIRSTGFFNAKAKSLRGMAKALVEKHGGEVPRTMSDLHALPGVGRKTANVVLGNVWNTPDGVVVDTHVGRLARRLGWTRHADPVKVEQDLNGRVPERTLDLDLPRPHPPRPPHLRLAAAEVRPLQPRGHLPEGRGGDERGEREEEEEDFFEGEEGKRKREDFFEGEEREGIRRGAAGGRREGRSRAF